MISRPLIHQVRKQPYTIWRFSLPASQLLNVVSPGTRAVLNSGSHFCTNEGDDRNKLGLIETIRQRALSGWNGTRCVVWGTPSVTSNKDLDSSPNQSSECGAMEMLNEFLGDRKSFTIPRMPDCIYF